MLLQIIISIMLLLAWASVIHMLRMKKLNLGEFILWSALWLGLLLTSLFPRVLGQVSDFLGIGRVVDMIVYLSVFVLFFMMFKLYMRMEAQERTMTDLVRNVAIRRASEKDNNKRKR
ncbi:DUF2304 domain-containing protein [Candidatus Woesearchaeota archaeon]|nr:DUF2304 domain-containing protein [Candidatus Woesearchaeota archaeon]